MKIKPSPDSCKERMYKAASALAARGDIRQRLRAAYRPLSVLLPGEFPVELQDRFRKVMEQISPRTGDFVRDRDPMFGMRDARGERIAQEIVDIFFSLMLLH